MTWRALLPKEIPPAIMGLAMFLMAGDELYRIHDKGGLWLHPYLGPAMLLASAVWFYRAYWPRRIEP